MIDNIEMKDLNDTSLKSIITFIPQTAKLFDDTVMANIKYANGKIIYDEIYRNGKNSGINGSIMKLQNGCYTQRLVNWASCLVEGKDRRC